MSRKSSSHIAKNLRYLRKQCGLSQEALARQVGLNRGNIASYEKGTAEPNTVKLIRISRFFDVNVVEMVEQDLSQVPTPKAESSTEVPSTAKTPTTLPRRSKMLLPELPRDTESLRDSFSQLQTILEGLYTYHQLRKNHKEERTAEVQVLEMELQQVFDLSHDLARICARLLNDAGTGKGGKKTSPVNGRHTNQKSSVGRDHSAHQS